MAQILEWRQLNRKKKAAVFGVIFGEETGRLFLEQKPIPTLPSARGAVPNCFCVFEGKKPVALIVASALTTTKNKELEKRLELQIGWKSEEQPIAIMDELLEHTLWWGYKQGCKRVFLSQSPIHTSRQTVLVAPFQNAVMERIIESASTGIINIENIQKKTRAKKTRIRKWLPKIRLPKFLRRNKRK